MHGTATHTQRMRDLELASEYRMLRRKALCYADMSSAGRRAYDRRLGAWLLATGMATDASFGPGRERLARILGTRSDDSSAAMVMSMTMGPKTWHHRQGTRQYRAADATRDRQRGDRMMGWMAPLRYRGAKLVFLEKRQERRPGCGVLC
jgi:hypothetical protein